jgi:RNA polymerase sigma-70 factor (ECF subfamily)
VEETDIESRIEESYPRILRAALVLSGNRWDAEDLAQETFLEAIGAWGRFGRRSDVNTWLYSILLNLHRRRLRSARRRWQRWLRWFHRRPGNPGADSPDRRLQWDEWCRSLWAAVALLPEPQQHAVVLRYSEGLSYEQIAEVLRCPVGTVKSRLHHGLAALARKLGDMEVADLVPPNVELCPKGTRR